MVKEPNPGSAEAVEAGCKCPVMDNLHGKGIPLTTSGCITQVAYWINGDCPIHGLPALRKAAEQDSDE